MVPRDIRIGLAGWSEATSRYRAHFAAEGTSLERYASTFDFVEVNVTFYRAVRPETFAGWSEQTPSDFRFSVKMNRSVTHAARLSENARVAEAIAPATGLGSRLAAFLVQLPPGLAFDASRTEAFLARLREHYSGTVALEPRHASWTGPDLARLIGDYAVTPVLTEIPEPDSDPSPHGTYVRLHGSPRRYRSAYASEQLRTLAAWLGHASRPAYVVFDNTAGPAGVRNALELREALA